ncbi:MAG: AMP-binding protein [Eubacterium sp.]|nr:AMP-binding protein [Eubacterium sp.]
MYNFVEKFQFHVKETPDKTAIAADSGAAFFSYKDIDLLSGRVYAYLKKKGIGKEDFVAIVLPRGEKPVVSMIGVVKAGAAFVLLEDFTPPERIAYIVQDCGCKLKITMEIWDEIMGTESLPGYEERDEHDAAFAVYTSGSTGSPKGVIHETGTIGQILRSFQDPTKKTAVRKSDVVVLLSPVSFVATCEVIFLPLSEGAEVHVLPFTIVKNPPALEEYLIRHEVTYFFLTPTLYRLMHNISPTVRQIVFASEMVSHVWDPDFVCICVYSSSESACCVSSFEIDKSYDRTPIGKMHEGIAYRIVDDHGKEVPKGDPGELCITVPYFRGYLHLTEKNKQAFDSERYFHTGDLVKELPDGNILLLGRLDEMIKVAGNRVEPAEVEAVVKQALGIQNCAAKGFTQDDATYICVYYTDDVEIDYGTARDRLLDMVPSYMVPSHFIKVPEFPRSANGKVNRSAFKPPVFSSYREEYAAPSDEIEEVLCRAFEVVLKQDKVGINDDFIALGGKSIDAIKVVSMTNLEGLTIYDLSRERTPARIAAKYRSYLENVDKKADEESEALRDQHLRQPHLLSTQQRYYFDRQLYAPKSIINNLGDMIRLPQDWDAQSLADAVNAVINIHPSLKTVFLIDQKTREPIQCYRPDKARTVTVEYITEAELEVLKKSLKSYFRLLDEYLYRCRIFKTEKGLYLFFDIHHAITDGGSLKIFLQDIVESYYGKKLKGTDNYYEVLQSRQDFRNKPEWKEFREYYKNRYNTEGYDLKPHTDPDTGIKSRTRGEMLHKMDVSRRRIDQAGSVCRISRTGFIVAAALLSMAEYNQSDRVMCEWVHNGRETAKDAEVFGMLIHSFYAELSPKPTTTVLSLLKDIQEQITSSLEHRIGIDYEETLKAQFCVLYQSNLLDVESLFGEGAEYIHLPVEEDIYEISLYFEVMDCGEGFCLKQEYAEDQYKRESIDKLGRLFNRVLTSLSEVMERPDMTVGDVIRLKQF